MNRRIERRIMENTEHGCRVNLCVLQNSGLTTLVHSDSGPQIAAVREAWKLSQIVNGSQQLQP